MATTTVTPDRSAVLLLVPDEDLADLERRLEAWLLIARHVVPGRS